MKKGMGEAGMEGRTGRWCKRGCGSEPLNPAQTSWRFLLTSLRNDKNWEAGNMVAEMDGFYDTLHILGDSEKALQIALFLKR